MRTRTSLIGVLLFATLAFAEDLEPAAFKNAVEKKPGVVLDVRTPDEVAKWRRAPFPGRA